MVVLTINWDNACKCLAHIQWNYLLPLSLLASCPFFGCTTALSSESMSCRQHKYAHADTHEHRHKEKSPNAIQSCISQLPLLSSRLIILSYFVHQILILILGTLLIKSLPLECPTPHFSNPMSSLNIPLDFPTSLRTHCASVVHWSTAGLSILTCNVLQLFSVFTSLQQ